MHLDAGGRQAGRSRPQQVFELRVGQGEDIGDRLVQQAHQRRPGPGGPAQGEHGVDPGARPEAGGGGAGPQQRGIGEQRRIGQAVHLHDGGTGPPDIRRLGLIGLGPGVEEAESGQVEPQRDPDPGIGAGGDLRGPVRHPRHPLRFLRGERPPGGHGRGRGPGQAVGDGIDERPDQRLRFGQPERAAAGQGRGVPLVRQGVGDGPQVHDVRGVEGTGAPGVGAVEGEPGQQPAARGEAQRMEGGGAPGSGGGMRDGPVRGAREQRQGVGQGQGHGGDGTCAHAVAVRAHHVDPRRGPRRDLGQGFAVGRPEGDTGLARDGGGQEDGRVAQQCLLLLRLLLLLLLRRLCCHRAPFPVLRSDGSRLSAESRGGQ